MLDANKITQLNSGCSIECVEDIGEDKGHELARETGSEVEKTHGVQDHLEDGEAGQLGEVMEGVDEMPGSRRTIQHPEAVPGQEMKEEEEDFKQRRAECSHAGQGQVL